MAGSSELSKAITYVIAEQCSKDNREIQVHLFDTGINQSIILEPRSGSSEEVLEFDGLVYRGELHLTKY